MRQIPIEGKLLFGHFCPVLYSLIAAAGQVKQGNRIVSPFSSAPYCLGVQNIHVIIRFLFQHHWESLSPWNSPGKGILLEFSADTDLQQFIFCYRNETVLHQFCCPAADAEQKPSSPDSSPRWEIAASKTFHFPSSASLSSIANLSAQDKIHVLYVPILLHPYVPCPQHCCPCLSPPRLLFILLCDCSGLHAHNPMHRQKCIFSLSSNIYSIKPHSRFYLFLPFCITLTLTYSCFTLLRQISYLIL